MNLKWLQALQGVVTVSIRGERQEELVNEVTRQKIVLSGIRRVGGRELECEVTVGDFFRLRPHLKRTGCRIHVKHRRGLPFWLRKLERRKFFAAGLFLFFAGLYILSSLVWSIEVKGNEKLTKDQIMQAARAEGVYPFQWSFRMKELDAISKHLVAKLPGVSWIGVDRQGTKVTIEVVESTTPPPLPLYSPRHLVASVDAVVTEVKAEKGKPVVAKNRKVKQGDILISGIIGNDGNTKTVVAKGDVLGLVWHVYEIESPLSQKIKVYTGESKTKWHLLLGNRTLQIWGFEKPEFERYESVETQHQLAWRNWTLPLGRVKERLMEVREDVRKLTEEEARETGILEAKAAVLEKAGKDARIVEQNILHEKTENGKVYMKVFFEVEQSIAKERAIVQMQGE
ncbi:sporulation protein YqfD [Paenibacillus sp. GCM10012307]|uniref:Sporulation protein YqfD n=1 Tax=Paenibacillus roseus TaxID=2798579 RepID=A0A934J7M0_9BACL|nr:sporulation protein YqfD [Paenibacillus roseus]MBJ6363108.1 sporulation protein YqfD [Paenibacillus roseus]